MDSKVEQIIKKLASCSTIRVLRFRNATGRDVCRNRKHTNSLSNSLRSAISQICETCAGIEDVMSLVRSTRVYISK